MMLKWIKSEKVILNPLIQNCMWHRPNAVQKEHDYVAFCSIFVVTQLQSDIGNISCDEIDLQPAT